MSRDLGGSEIRLSQDVDDSSMPDSFDINVTLARQSISSVRATVNLRPPASEEAASVTTLRPRIHGKADHSEIGNLSVALVTCVHMGISHKILPIRA